MDEMDRLVDFATSRDRGVGVVLGKKGSGKSFLLAAVATSLYR
jgi:DNA replication protein DnaC